MWQCRKFLAPAKSKWRHASLSLRRCLMIPFIVPSLPLMSHEERLAVSKTNWGRIIYYVIVYQHHFLLGYNGRHESWIFVRKGHHWLHCVSHRSGVPMWILTTILLLSSFFLLWLCCASTSTAPSTKVSTKKVSTYYTSHNINIDGTHSDYIIHVHGHSALWFSISE